MDPLIVNVANPGIKFTTVLFAKETDCLLVGDSDGQVAVYELRNMPTASDTSRVRLGCKLFRSVCESVGVSLCSMLWMCVPYLEEMRCVVMWNFKSCCVDCMWYVLG